MPPEKDHRRRCTAATGAALLSLIMSGVSAHAAPLQKASRPQERGSAVDRVVWQGRRPTAEERLRAVLVRFERGAGYFHECTGALVAPNVAVTAAHCFFWHDGSLAKPTEVLFSTVEDKIATQRRVIASARHDRYAYEKWENDLAIVVFAGDIPEGHIPASLSHDPGLITHGKSGSAVGGGESGGTGPHDVLKALDLQVMQPKTQEGLFTAYAPGAALCGGDSGGPVFIRDGGELKLAGIVAGSQASVCDKVAFGVITNISSHHRWLESSIRASQARVDALANR